MREWRLGCRWVDVIINIYREKVKESNGSRQVFSNKYNMLA